jgi:hypothetical protein
MFKLAALILTLGFAEGLMVQTSRLISTHGRQRSLALRAGLLMFAEGEQQVDELQVDVEVEAVSFAPSALSAAASTTAMCAVLLTSAPALAATDAAGAVPSALAAYAHFVSLIVVTMCLVTERLSIKPDMTEADFDRAVSADIGYGVAGLVEMLSPIASHWVKLFLVRARSLVAAPSRHAHGQTV